MLSKAYIVGVSIYVATVSAKSCYTPAGTIRDLDFETRNGALYLPCNNDTDTESMCCGFGPGKRPRFDSCRPDGLCDNSSRTKVYRESCTDPTWQHPACLKLFLNGTGYQNGDRFFEDGGKTLADVVVTLCDDGSYCYERNNTACCLQGQGVFLDAQGQQTNVRPNTTASRTITTTIGTEPTNPPSKTAIPSDSGNGDLSTAAKVGIAAGVAAALVLSFGVLALFILSRTGESKLRVLEMEHKNCAHEIGPENRIHEMEHDPRGPVRYATEKLTELEAP